VPKLVDTTIRLLGQDPLAGRLPTAELLRLAEILDRAGFAYLEVSGGGVFDSMGELDRGEDGRQRVPELVAERGQELVLATVGLGQLVDCLTELGLQLLRLFGQLDCLG